MEWLGLLMLLLVAVLLIATGLPAFMVLIGVAAAFAVFGIAAGAFTAPILSALPNRIVGLLETDLLQALPLYVLMGVLLNRLPIASILFRAGDRGLARTGAAPQISAMSLGALLAPMNGSVGASVSTLSHVVRPRLVERGVAPEQSLATICVASTLGVVIPPSLVLILLGDAMMRAHTEAASKTSAAVRIINTQDVFRGSLTPAAIFFVLCIAIAWWTGRRSTKNSNTTPLDRTKLRASEWLAAGITVAFILVLLAGVTIGYFYAVEAAAMGAFALFLFGLLSGALKPAMISGIARDAMAVAGALFALLAAATTFTLVFRAFGTDRLLDRLIADLPGGPTGTAIVVLLVLSACAFVLDAFELIFVVVPVVMPALLMRVPDAVWVSVATLLVLQASFLIPPFGYAVMMARTMMSRGGGFSVPIGRLARSLAPYLAAQLVVLALVVAFPGVAHFASPSGGNASTLTPVRSDEDTKKQFDNIMPNSGQDEPPPPPQFK
jgi:tripartite ATP-independent transporter DctM subunit